MTDEEMVVAYVDSSDLQALERLIERYFSAMRRLAYSMVLDHVDADDVVQEVFVQVVKSLKTFRRESAFSTWLYRVAMNTIYRFLAKRKKARAIFGQGDAELSECASPSTESDIVCAELDRAIQHALAQLKPKLRSAIVMTTFEDIPPAEIAVIEGVSRTTIYWRIHSARQELKKLLGEWL